MKDGLDMYGGVKMLRCFCGETFFSKAGLENHLEDKHPIGDFEPPPPRKPRKAKPKTKAKLAVKHLGWRELTERKVVALESIAADLKQIVRMGRRLMEDRIDKET